MRNRSRPGVAVLIIAAIAVLVASAHAESAIVGAEQRLWEQALMRSYIYEESGRNAYRLLKGWYANKLDPETSLYSKGRAWDYHNEAADHYSSLVLIAYFVDTPAIAEGGILHKTLMKSIELCSTPSGIPCPYDLKNMTKLDPGPGNEGKLVYGAAEWCRDGLIRVAEVMGTENDWYRQLEEITTAIMTWAEKENKGLPGGVEVNGEMLQTLSRLYAMSGDEKYLRWAEGIADHYLLGDPIKELKKFSFIDHGCELVPGLGELFVLECQLNRPKAEEYHQPLQQLLDRLLEIGRKPESGLWYMSADLETGEAKGESPDTWGYVLYTYENYDRGTGENRYFDAIQKPMRWLVKNRKEWTDTRDRWSDSYESMIILWKRYPEVSGVFDWLHWMTWRHRGGGDKEFGPYRGAHDDGSTGRCLVNHARLASQGVRAIPYAEGVRLGGAREDNEVFLILESDAAWSGRICFDWPRSQHKAAVIDWARINETPEFFTVSTEGSYIVSIDSSKPVLMKGMELIEGLKLDVKPGERRKIRVSPAL